MTMHTIDLNCDMGEGVGNDEAIMPYISSANIACGYHAGDVETISKTLLLAKKFGVNIGAHPSFPDRENFGRIEMQLPLQKVYELVLLQIQFLLESANAIQTKLHHVKPHGALYNMAAKDAELAKTIAQAVHDAGESLILFGLSGSHLISQAKAMGIKTASEVFADRTYRDDGTLTPRSQPNALIENAEHAVQQALQMIKQGTVTTVSGKIIPIVAETICIHGDGEHAVEFAKVIHYAIK